MDDPEYTAPPKLGRMLRLWIAAGLIDQVDAARQIGVSESNLSRWINGDAIPSGRSLAKILTWMLEP